MSISPFLVPIRALSRTGGARGHEVRSGRLDGLSVTGSWVPADAEVTVDVALETTSGGIVVTGRVGADWTGDCRRCLRPTTGRLDVAVRELYERRRGHRASRPDEDEDTYPLSGETLDLRPLARDAVVLNLPQTPLCRSGCAGLCPTCGADRNVEPCNCRHTSLDERWAALDALRGQSWP